ncbi:MAG: response regulator [Desulfobacterales bacterium]|jgi:DNA-binding response OmpR family regulator
MIPNVLIVNNDRETLATLEEEFAKYNDIFAVLTAEDGQAAVEVLRHDTVSLVVTDLKMPRIDGLGLLKHVIEGYPEIPVIVITPNSAPEMERLVREGGAVGYFSKPFRPESLVRKIMTLLRRESDGGTLHRVSSGIFLQLIEMEQKTCTIRLEDISSGQKGVLFFRDGELLDARVAHMKGKPAAQRIFTWDKVTLSIQNDCPPIENKIQSELQTLILEAARLKDEAASPDGDLAEAEEPSGETDAEEVTPSVPISRIRHAIEKRIGQADGVEDIYQDTSWDGFIHRLSALGELFRSGPMKLCFVDKGESSDHIIIPGRKTTVISVSPKSPRDKIMKALSP